MIVGTSRDGDEFDYNELRKNGFTLEENDYRKRLNDNPLTKSKYKYTYVFNFVGFLINNTSDIYVIFPKSYIVKNEDIDSSMIFRLISKHIQQSPDTYLGNELGEKFKTDYPFASFFGIYEYYNRYGLYVEEQRYIKPNVGGKINWKETIRRSNKFIFNDQLLFFPLYQEKNIIFQNF